jgi:hypothetical protein
LSASCPGESTRPTPGRSRRRSPRPQGVPVGGLGEPSGVDADGFLVDAEELLDRPLGLLVVALAEVVEADSAVAIDEVDAPAQLLGRERFRVEPDRRAVERREVAMGGVGAAERPVVIGGLDRAHHHTQGNGKTIRRITMSQPSAIHSVELNPMTSVRRRGCGRRSYQRRRRALRGPSCV